MKEIKICSKILNNKNFSVIEFFGLSYISAFAPNSLLNKENASFLDKSNNILFIRCNDKESLELFGNLLDKNLKIVIFFNYKNDFCSNIIIDNNELCLN